MKKDLENNLNKDEIVDKENDVNVEETTEQKNDFIENTNVTKDDKASEDNLDVDKITEEEEYDEEFNHDGVVEELSFGIHSLEDKIKEDVSNELENKTSKENKNKSGNSIVAKSVIASSIASLIVTGGMMSLNKNVMGPKATITIEDTTVDNVYKAVATKATPSVVGITTLTVNTNNFFNIPLESEGVGSGVIVDSRGYILTNSHVVNDGQATKVSVIFADSSSVDGEVVWNDAKLDIAIVKVQKDNLDVCELGDSDKVEVGDIAVAIGNPLGIEFSKTVTQGIISGLNRVITTENGEMDDLIQTDASINPGNSGGPLLNNKGQVIGINTAKASNAEGLGFSIPINTIKPIIEQVIEDGNFEKVALGIKGVDAAQFELEVENGVYVVSVEADSVARKAGISSGDIIVELDSKKIENMTGLVKTLYKYNKGDKATVKLYRDGKEKQVQVQF